MSDVDDGVPSVGSISDFGEEDDDWGWDFENDPSGFWGTYDATQDDEDT